MESMYVISRGVMEGLPTKSDLDRIIKDNPEDIKEAENIMCKFPDCGIAFIWNDISEEWVSYRDYLNKKAETLTGILQEQISILEKRCYTMTESRKEYKELAKKFHNELQTLKGNLEIVDCIVSNTVKNEQAGKCVTDTVLFESIESFAKYIHAMLEPSITSLSKIFEDKSKDHLL